MDLHLLEMMSVILITAVVVLLIFNKLKLPSMIGLFLTGVILSFFITSTEVISSISELGVIFLLFIIGLEFSIEKFSEIKHYALIGGVLQVLVTTILVAIITFLVGIPINEAIFMGFLVCFSSTAIVMKLIQKNGLNHTLQGKVTLGILIFQDLAVILVILMIPLLAGQSIDVSNLPELIFSLVALGVLIFVGGKWVVPKVLEEAAYTKNRDLFLLLVLFICLGTTYATSYFGISPELGAFIAGLLISRTEYSHQTLGYIQPFQDVFMSLFLISIGLMIDVKFFIYNIVIIIALATVVIVVKFIATFLTGRVLKLPIKTTVAISILLSQIGEFSFVLAEQGMNAGLLGSDLFTGFLSISIITMSATPFLIKHTPKITKLIKKLGFKDKDKKYPKHTKQMLLNVKRIESELEDHVIIVGLGLTGKNIAFSCEQMNIDYICVDNDPMVVEQEKQSGVPIIYGDGYSETVLKELKVMNAKCLVVTTSNSDHLVQIVDAAKRLNPYIHIIVRTRFVKNVDALYDAGADEVIPEEFETSIVMFRLVMDYYHKNLDEVNNILQELRGERYKTLRQLRPDNTDNSITTPDGKILESIYVEDENSIKDFNFDEYNLKPVSIIRDNYILSDITDDYNVEEDDLVLFKGLDHDIENFINEKHDVD